MPVAWDEFEPVAAPEQDTKSGVNWGEFEPAEPIQIKPSAYEKAELEHPGIGAAAMGPGTDFTQSLFEGAVTGGRKLGEGISALTKPLGMAVADVLNATKMATAPETALTLGKPEQIRELAAPEFEGRKPFIPLPLAAPNERGVIPSLSRFAESLETPEGVALLAAVPESALARTVFAAQAAGQVPQALKDLATAQTGGQAAGAATDLLLNTGMAALMGRAKTKGIPDAREISPPTEVHGDVRPQPESRVREVPVEESSPGIQPQAEEGPTRQAPSAVLLTPENRVLDPHHMVELDAATFNAALNEAKTQPTKAGYDMAESVGSSPETLDQLAQYEKRAEKEVSDALAQQDPALAIAINSKKQYFTEGLKWRAAINEALEKQTMDLKDLAAIERAHGVGDTGDAAGKMLKAAVEREIAKEPSAPKTPAPVEAAAPVTTPVTEATLQSTSGHGLPAGVPDRGETFPSELMEASRQLGALVRSRATLRPGTLGQFVRQVKGLKREDKIEVGTIENQATVAHEIGHSIDGLVFPKQNFARSQASLAARVGTGTKQQLVNELVPISELMRGPITGSAGHKAYRRSATELIADYFSIYAHDPARARAMAPKFSEGFERELASHPDVHGVVHQLVEGSVSPLPPKRPPQPAGTPTALPGQVAARSTEMPPRETQAAIAAQGLVKTAVRDFKGKVESARILADKWRNLVKDAAERNDVGAFVEGIGNIEIPADTIDSVQRRMTPAMERLAKDYRYRQELQRQEINQYLKGTQEGEYLKFLQDYLGHFYADSASKLQGAISKWSKDSPHAKQRKLPTLREAIDLGLTPITQDVATLYELTSNINWRVATNRKFLSQLKDLRTSSGEPVIVPAKDGQPGWVFSDNPLIQRTYARQVPNGVMIWRGGAAVHPDIWHAVRMILDNPTSTDIGKAWDAINGFTRANAFAFSLFHDLTLRSAAVGSMIEVKNPFRGVIRIMEKNPISGKREVLRSTRSVGKELMQDESAVSDAAQHGLRFTFTDSETYQKSARDFLERLAAKTRDVPFIGTMAKVARDLQHWRQKGLWGNTHDAYKIVTYNDLVSKALQDAPKGTDPYPVKERIASLLNDAYGGQEWETKFWLEPKTRQFMSRFLLAPDWTFSTLRSVPALSDIASGIKSQGARIGGRGAAPVQYEGVRGNLGRLRFWGGEIAALVVATAATQYAIYQAFGKKERGDQPFIWDNEANNRTRIDVTPLMRRLPWRDPKDPTRYYVNLGKRPEEILRWFSSPEVNIESKMSRPVAEIFKQITGDTGGGFKAEWKRDHEAFLESVPTRAKSVLTEAVPFVFSGNQFALSVPVRKGMTKYKAQEAYESIYELAANPNRFRSFLRGQQASEGDLRSMVSQVTEAATRNGVNAEEIRKRSLSIVRGHHYNEFFKALKAGDAKTLRIEAHALLKLGTTDKGLEESIKRHATLESAPP